MAGNPHIAEVVAALALYLAANPHACDSAEGIARWWLMDQGDVAQELRGALDWMVRHGYLQVQTATDGRSRYRRHASVEALRHASAEFCRTN